MKTLNRILAVFLIVTLLGGCLSVSAWDEPLGEDKGEAEGEIYVDNQPLPLPIEYYEEMSATGEDDTNTENDKNSGDRRRDSAPLILGTPVVVSNEPSEGSMFWTYLRTSKEVQSVSISYYCGDQLKNASVFGVEYVYDFNADSDYWDWCLPYRYSPAGTEPDYSRTTFLRASYDGENWSSPVESCRFIVIPVQEVSIVLDVPYFKQNDPEWKDVKIATRTIGAVGCTTTSIAMIYSYRNGKRTTPEDMRDILSYSGNDLLWSSVTDLAFDLTYCERTGEKGVPEGTLESILAALKLGHPVVFGATSSGKSTSNQHWVVVYGYSGNPDNLDADDFMIFDPNSSKRNTLEDFLQYKPYPYMLVS